MLLTRSPLSTLAFLTLVSTAIISCGAADRGPRADARRTAADGRLIVPTPAYASERSANVLWDTYYLRAALDVIDGAGTEIDVVQFEFAYGKAVSQIQNALTKAKERGVTVRVWLDDEPKVSHNALPHLLQRGFDASLDNSETRVHTKMILADRRKVLFGSTNFSASSILFNHETDILIDDPLVGEACAQYAARLRQAPSEPAGIAPVTTANFDVHFDRTFENELMKLLESAEERIELQMYGTSLYLDDPMSPPTRAFNLLKAAAERGVHVRVILERAKDDDFGRETNRRNSTTASYLEAAGIDVKFDREDVISHAKLLIVDNTATVGSMNWGYGGFRKYHEINAIVRDPALVEDFSRYFEILWQEAR